VRKTAACTGGLGQAKNGARQNTIFSRGLNVIGLFKPIIEYFAFSEGKIRCMVFASRRRQRGVSRSSRT
jgi:hypothetical protein